MVYKGDNAITLKLERTAPVVRSYLEHNMAADAEIISIGYELLRRIGLNKVELHINSLEDTECRKKYNETLKAYLEGKKDRLCPLCNEQLIQKVSKEVLGKEMTLPIERLTYQEAMDRFGSDKPDVRYGVELTDLTGIVTDSGFAVFENALALGALRQEVAKRQELVNKDEYRFVWFTEFPLLEYDEEAGRYTAMHHSFTMPIDENLALMDTDPG